MTLSFTNPVESLLKVTLLKIEEGEKVTVSEKGKHGESGDKADDSKVEEDKTDSTEKGKEDGAKEKEEKNADEEGKKKEEGSEKAAEDKKKDSSFGVIGMNRKLDRNIDNSCEGRSFVPTAKVKYEGFVPFLVSRICVCSPPL